MQHSSALAISLALLAACGGGSGSPDANSIDATPPVGTISASWQIQDPADSSVLSCEDVAGKTVTASVIPVDGFDGVVSAFSCSAGMATSQQIQVGKYDVTFDLTTTGARSLVAQTVTIPDVEVVQSQDSALGAVTFEVEPKGTLNFKLNADATGPNCAAFDAGGGGLTALRFTVKDGAGTCLDGIVLAIGAGGGQTGTYTTNCAAPPTFDGCIENDQTITVADIRSGTYRLEVSGDRDGLDCYSGVGDPAVPGNSLSVDLGDVSLALAATIECNPNLPDAGP